MTRKVWRKWAKLVGGLILFSLLGAAFVFFLKSDFWRVKKISCQVNGQECLPELRSDLTRLLQAEDILFLSANEIIEKVGKRRPELSRVQVKKRLPSELIFQLEERQPEVAVMIEGAPEGNFYLVDREGVFLEKVASSSGLPFILVNSLAEPERGEKLDQSGIKRAVDLLVGLQLRLLKPQIAKITSEKEIEIQLGNEIQTIFSLKKDLEEQLDSLQFIFSRTKIEGRQPRRVDLRFDKPVITYE